MNGSHIKYKLMQGSSLLRVVTWRAMARLELKALIQRFATRENNCYKNAKPGGALWRRRRLTAISVYEGRFGQPPAFFCQRTLPKLDSYYVVDGQYLWPSSAQPVVQAGRANARPLTLR